MTVTVCPALCVFHYQLSPATRDQQIFSVFLRILVIGCKKQWFEGTEVLYQLQAVFRCSTILNCGVSVNVHVYCLPEKRLSYHGKSR